MSTLFETSSTGIAPGVGLARVAVERGIDRWPEGLTYSIPAALEDLRAGDRVLVPLGKGDAPTPGYVVSREQLPREGADAGGIDRDKLKSILSRDDRQLALPPKLMDLAAWVAAYYACPIGVALAGIVPGAVKRGAGAVTRVFVDLAPTDVSASSGVERSEDHDVVSLRRAVRLSAKQRAVLEQLEEIPAHERPVDVRRLVEAAGLASPAPIRGLITKGLLVATRRTSVEATWRGAMLDSAPPPTPTTEQQTIIDAVGAALGKGFSSHLLLGVTGSGKTEVYLRLIERVLALGKAALLLVPEIALTPQTGGRVVSRFPTQRVAILHSALTAAQRHQQWRLVAEGGADIVLGARSAIFAPLPNDRLGLIVVDEEHDGSYKQDQAPRYHGRDVALRRGQLEGCPVILGSATPALETWANATVRGTLSLHRLHARAPGLTTPHVELVDFRAERRLRAQSGDRAVHLIGPRLEAAIGHALAHDGQIILLLNRRGFANSIACPDLVCGWMQQCDQCDATMIAHRDLRVRGGLYIRCHHCLSEQLLPSLCPRCGKKVSVFGLGTQRVEEELARKFPQLRTGETMLRVDGDTMPRAADFHDALSRFASGELRMLLGTQMIAKGLDFPGVRLVGVISADTALSLPDFRAAERTFQLVSQVAGRCGRGAEAGVALVQTFEPTFAPIMQAAAGDYEGFAASELAARAEANLPPSTRLVNIVVRDVDLNRAVDSARRLVEALRGLAASSVDQAPGSAITIDGPMPCSISRIANRHRQQVLLSARSAGPLQRLLASARDSGALRPGEEMAVDVDPQALM